ncbi:MAG: TldD/PmbA family protein [Verrucomicrobiota bacterium]
MNLSQFTSIVVDGSDCLLRLGYGFADARIDNAQTLAFEFADGECIRWHERHQVGSGIRVLRAGVFGFAAAEGPPAWRPQARRAWQLAGAGATPAPTLGGVLASVPALNALARVEPGEFEFPSAEEVQLLMKEARELFPDARWLKLRGQFRRGWRGIISSEGTKAIKPVHAAVLGLSIGVANGAGRTITLPLHAAGATGRLATMIRNQFASAKIIASQLATAKSSPADQGDVLLSPQMAALLVHEAFGHLCEADRFPPNRGKLAVLGTVVGSTALNISDHTRFSAASGAESFDDEGVPCEPSPLVVEGRWEGLLHTRTTAALSGHIPTGNARVTSWTFQPLARMRTTEIAAGGCDPKQMLGGIKDGVFLDRPYGGQIRGARFRIQAATAWRIRNGQLAEPIADRILTGDPLNILRQICGIGSDSQVVDGVGWCRRGAQGDLPVSMAAPTVLVREAETEPVA